MKTDKKFERIYSVAAFAAVYFIAAGITIPLFTMANSFLTVAAGFLAVLAAMLAGYWFQAFVCFISHFDRERDVGTYEATVKYLNVGRALPVIIIEIIAGLLSVNLFKAIFFGLIDAGVFSMDYYDRNSLYPFLFAVFFTLLTVVGSILWFYPYQRFTLFRFTVTGFVLLFIAFVFGVFAGMAAATAVCLFGYSLSALFLMNQGTITRGYSSFDRVSFLTSRARVYNILMTASLLLIYVVSTFLIAVILAGLAVIGRFILALIFHAADTGSEPFEQEVTPGDISDIVLGATHYEKASNSAAITIFLALTAAVIIFFLFRKNHAFARFLVKIKDWLASIFEFMFAFYDRRPEKRKFFEEGFRSYKDEERKIQRAAISDFSEKKINAKNYRDFVVKLNSIREGGKRVGYAYAVLVRQLISSGKAVKPSDTPREIAKKLTGDPYYDGIDGITEAFETVAYSGKDIDETSADMTVATLCTILKRHLA